jgi:hypothetical protein
MRSSARSDQLSVNETVEDKTLVDRLTDLDRIRSYDHDSKVPYFYLKL